MTGLNYQPHFRGGDGKGKMSREVPKDFSFSVLGYGIVTL